MLVTQSGLLVGIGALGHLRPQVDTVAIFVVCLMIALLSATQDIAIDAFRREILPDSELGLGNAVHVNTYKVASLVPGSLSLILSDTLSWVSVFWITALFMLPAVGMTLWVSEPVAASRPLSLRSAVVDPFKEFITRSGWRVAATLLAFMLLFRVGDALCQSLATPFYLDMGYSKTQIGLVAKHAGLWPAVIGGMVGGLVMVRIGINRALWIFGASQIVAILGFAYLASHGRQELVARHELLRLAAVIATEYLANGLCTAAFVAFIAQCAHPAYTATQLALFSSLMSVPRALVSASSGFLVAEFGWVQFYLLSAVLSLPGMFLLLRAAPWNSTGETPKWAAVET
jgi:PAT family beta-lactamase induction signal transducer AmpG